MKIKQDFVTNSSSTSFTFVFKGDKLDLYVSLIERRDLFNLSFDNYNIGVWDVIRALDSIIKTTQEDLWILPEIQTINTVIEQHKYHQRYYKDLAEKEKGEKKSWSMYDSYLDVSNRAKIRIDILERAKERGLKNALVVGFGDNDGEISGCSVGIAMDYEGRKINIDDKDLIIYSEQNR